MNYQHLTTSALVFAITNLLLLAGLSIKAKLDISSTVLWSGLRAIIQLSFIGVVLNFVFANGSLWLISLMSFIMLAIACFEIHRRQTQRFTGGFGILLHTIPMFISGLGVTVLALQVVTHSIPWYTPQYAIPLLGMLLGNAMNGVALGLDRLNHSVIQQRASLEARLLLGFTAHDAIAPLRREAVRGGLIPAINSMAVVGVVSLPGMMTGQILSGVHPNEAVKYQIFITLLITASTGYATLLATGLAARGFFDRRERLRLDRLVS